MAYFWVTSLMLVGIFLILLVLVQRGRGGGLAGAFGGMGGQSAFGTKAGDVFTKITIGTAVLWVLLAGASIHALRPEAKFKPPEQTKMSSGADEDKIPTADAEEDDTSKTGTDNSEPESKKPDAIKPETSETTKPGPVLPNPNEAKPDENKPADEKPESTDKKDSE